MRRVALLLGLLVLPFASAAQSTSRPVSASATIDLPPITGIGTQNFRFGPLAPGNSGNVAPGPAAPTAVTSSAGWRFSGFQKQRSIQAAFSLPPALVRGAFAIPLEWDNAGYGTMCVSNRGGPCASTLSFNPAANGGVQTLSIPKNTPGNNFDIDVYVGGRTGSVNVPPGTYSAQVTLTMTYLN